MNVLSIIINIALAVLIIVFLLKNNKTKGLEHGKPIVLMSNSIINGEGMKEANIGIDELMSLARCAGYFNLGDIDTAIMEPNGKTSFLPLPMKRQLNPKDFNFAPVREGLCRVIISDGRLIKDNLFISGISEESVFELLRQRGDRLQDIMTATVNEAGRVDFFRRSS